MEEFLTTVDEAREYIDVELKECNNRIHELENEIQELRTENHLYKQQLTKNIMNFTARGFKEKRGVDHLEEEVDGYYDQAKKEMEDFYFRLNEQIIDFMESSKKQYQDFNKNIHAKIHEVKEEKIPTRVSSPKREQVAPLSAVKSKAPKLTHHNRIASVTIGNKTPKSPKTPKTPITPKTPKSIGLDSRKRTPKKSVDFSVNRAIDFQNGSQSTTSRKKGACTSGSRSEVDSRINTIGPLNDLGAQKNPTSHALSPKSSLLRAKLKSDMVLQEMRKKLGEGLSNA